MFYKISREQSRANILTSSLLGLMFMFFYFVKWQLNNEKPIVKTEFMEVNLGDAEDGMGQTPIMKNGTGDTKPVENVNANEQKDAQQNQQMQDQVAAEAHNEKDVPEVKPVEKKKNIKKENVVKKAIPKKTKQEVIVKKIFPKAVITYQPKVEKITSHEIEKTEPKPKAIFKGMDNVAGNGAPISNAITSQGIGKAEMGDMGKQNGNPNSNNYLGSGGNGGTQINMSSDLLERGIASMPKFEAEFNQNATIIIEIKVDENGSATFLRVKKMNTMNPQFISIIKQKLQQLTFKAKDEESFGTIEFKFKINR